MDTAVYYIKSLALIGIVAIGYFLILGLLEIVVKKLVITIKTAVNDKHPNTFDLNKEHFLDQGQVGLSRGYWNNIRQESLGIDFKSSIKSWEEIKGKVFKNVDINKDVEISNDLQFLKGVTY